MTPKILHVIPSFHPATRYGGPIENVFRLCQAMRRAGADILITYAASEVAQWLREK